MSSPAQGGPSVPNEKEKEKKGLGKVLSRMKTVFKKADRRLSTLGSSKAATSSAAAAPATTRSVLFALSSSYSYDPIKSRNIGGKQQPACDRPRSHYLISCHSEPAPPAAEVPAAVEATKIPRSQIFAERAKKLGEVYGLELKPSEWHSTEGHALRVEKPIRMRVHRKCHLCTTSFGVGKECPKCKHVRCKECPRVPPKRTEAEREESRKKRAALIKERAEKAPIIPDWDPTPKKIVLKRPAKTGGQDLYYRKPRQRIRRNCCQCQRMFTGTKTCEGCQHTRCTDCPRDP
jgi:hypothetical protein